VQVVCEILQVDRPTRCAVRTARDFFVELRRDPRVQLCVSPKPSTVRTKHKHATGKTKVEQLPLGDATSSCLTAGHVLVVHADGNRIDVVHGAKFTARRPNAVCKMCAHFIEEVDALAMELTN
jgi:hypothetical protein